MIKPKGIVVAVSTVLIVVVIIVASWIIISTGQVASNFYIVPRVLVSAPVALDQSFESAEDAVRLRYPSGWVAQVNDAKDKISITKAKQILASNADASPIELNHSMVGSFNYPFRCNPNDASLASCAGKELPTGAFLDIHSLYHQESSVEDIIATAKKFVSDPDDIRESPITFGGTTAYEWKGLQCGPKCYVLRALIIPQGEHRTLQLFANVYINESLNQQELGNVLRSYQEQLDAIIGTLTIQ